MWLFKQKTLRRADKRRAFEHLEAAEANANAGAVIPGTGRPLIPRSEGKQCCFKPHAVKVVYLFVPRDVTTHPCLRGRKWR